MTTEPIRLLREFIIALHERLIADYGGSPGLRDEGLLESALARPMHLFHYGDPSIPDLAAAYAIGISIVRQNRLENSSCTTGIRSPCTGNQKCRSALGEIFLNRRRGTAASPGG